ncbi:MAG: hypothetical protein MUF08_00630 [Burkholderiaceae bacterium]|jgi:hypothetical protein|nr:hypothetical protein [Burkholderiaceae bacterium]
MTQSNAKTQAPNLPASPVGDLRTVRAKLVLAGWPTMKAWAEAHGYQRGTVSYAIRSWGMRTDRQPHGGLARAVMGDLRRTLAKA